MSVRAFIADDEPPARSKIRKFLEACPELQLVGEAGDGVSAIGQILEVRPDLLFLDIQMPRGDGFEVLREIYPQHKPRVIFTTAYDQYAIRAFEVEAIDYLLKPFTADRFHAAVQRALRDLEKAGPQTNKLERLLEQLSLGQTSPPRLLVRKDDRMFFLKASEIEWIEAEEKYVLLHTRSQSHMIRHAMSALERQLSSAGFVRIHRSHLINLDALQELVSLGRGDCVAVLKSGTRLNVGRNFKEKLLASMGHVPAQPEAP